MVAKLIYQNSMGRVVLILAHFAVIDPQDPKCKAMSTLPSTCGVDIDAMRDERSAINEPNAAFIAFFLAKKSTMRAIMPTTRIPATINRNVVNAFHSWL